MKRLLLFTLILYGVFTLINSIWELIDTIEFGGPQPSFAGTLAAVFLTQLIGEIIWSKLLSPSKSEEQERDK